MGSSWSIVSDVYWDNGGRGGGGEKFGLIDRNPHRALYPELVKALQRAATNPYSLSNIALPKPSK